MGCASSSDASADGTADAAEEAPPIVKSERFYTRVVFLDVDGVLNTATTDLLDPVRLARLAEIQQQADAKIVLSSSWRLHETKLHPTKS